MEEITDAELIAWFTNRSLPEGKFRVNAFTTTDNLTGMVELAIGNLSRNKAIARTHLLEIKAKLETASKNQTDAATH